MKLAPGKLYTVTRKFKFMDATAKEDRRIALGTIYEDGIVMFIKRQKYINIDEETKQEVVFLHGDRLITGSGTRMDECPERYFKEIQTS